MFKVITVSILVMILGCRITDKLEEMIIGKIKVEQNSNKDSFMDKETLKILSDYGLLNGERYDNSLTRLNKA